jgi:hypothetical protein
MEVLDEGDGDGQTNVSPLATVQGQPLDTFANETEVKPLKK